MPGWRAGWCTALSRSGGKLAGSIRKIKPMLSGSRSNGHTNPARIGVHEAREGLDVRLEIRCERAHSRQDPLGDPPMELADEVGVTHRELPERAALERDGHGVPLHQAGAEARVEAEVGELVEYRLHARLPPHPGG